jgi:hypothetical protein
MSGPLDPTRISTFELSKPDVVVKVRAIAKTKIPVDLEWDVEAFSRANAPPDVRTSWDSGISLMVYVYRHDF